jgi:hypothetical protein
MRWRFIVKLYAILGMSIVILVASVPVASASAPGPGAQNTTVGSPGNPQQPVPDAAWLAKKQAQLVRSGIGRKSTKGAATTPYIVDGATPDTVFPSSYELPLLNPVPTTFEPGDGNYANYGSGTSHLDDANPGHTYNDHDFFNLCGPGAADVALWYWPNPPNLMNNGSVTDTAHTSTTTSWNSTDRDNTSRMRGYMTYLAWQTQWPGWSHKGMMDNAHYYSYGTTLYGLMDGLNWEASGRNSSTWANYFYVIQWNGSNGPNTGGVSSGTLLTDVMNDTYNSNVPVVVEVNAQLMPNWTNNNGDTHHFITVIGFDNSLGIYYYTDTCASSTGCGSKFDGSVRTAPQSTLYKAMLYIAQNQSTDPSGGDGGWVW